MIKLPSYIMQQINFSVKTSPSGNLQGKKYIIGAECVCKNAYMEKVSYV